MKNLLGIGTAGSKIANNFKGYENYKIYTISNESSTTNCKFNFSIEERDSAEEYENSNYKSIEKFLKQIKDEVTVFVCGASTSSAITLRVLEPLYRSGVSIDVVYFAPDISVLSGDPVLQERTVRGVLQEYSRSGVFRGITLVSNKTLESIPESINVFEYYEQINEVFANSYHCLLYTSPSPRD